MKNIKYQLATEINRGTPEEPNIEMVLSDVSMPYTEGNYAIAQAEAYQGQVIVEDDGEPEPVPTPTPEPRATNAQSLAAVNFARMMLPSMASTMSADDTITVSALYDEWTEGSYQVGDIRLAWYSGSHQPWKCRQEHDTATYPDIAPDGSAWRTFWIPFHGTTPETAQDWIAPSGAHDQYEVGEYMIYNSQTYRCKEATAYSPEECAQAWEAV